MHQDIVEEIEERRFPIVVFVDALRIFGDAVIESRIEVSRSAGTEIQREAAVRRIGQFDAAAHVVRQRAHFQSFRDETIAKRFRRFQHRVHDPSSSTTSSTNSSSSSSSIAYGTSSFLPKSMSDPPMPNRAARCLFSFSSERR